MTLPTGYASTTKRARFRAKPRFVREPCAPLTADERRIIDWIERDKSRKLTPQEINLSRGQARAIGSI